jgi:hypothetical protein
MENIWKICLKIGKKLEKIGKIMQIIGKIGKKLDSKTKIKIGEINWRN